MKVVIIENDKPVETGTMTKGQISFDITKDIFFGSKWQEIINYISEPYEAHGYIMRNITDDEFSRIEKVAKDAYNANAREKWIAEHGEPKYESYKAGETVVEYHNGPGTMYFFRLQQDCNLPSYNDGDYHNPCPYTEKVSVMASFIGGEGDEREPALYTFTNKRKRIRYTSMEEVMEYINAHTIMIPA